MIVELTMDINDQWYKTNNTEREREGARGSSSLPCQGSCRSILLLPPPPLLRIELWGKGRIERQADFVFVYFTK